MHRGLKTVESGTHPLSLDEPSSSPSEQQPQKVVPGCVKSGETEEASDCRAKITGGGESVEERQVNCHSLFFCF